MVLRDPRRNDDSMNAFVYELAGPGGSDLCAEACEIVDLRLVRRFGLRFIDEDHGVASLKGGSACRYPRPAQTQNCDSAHRPAPRAAKSAIQTALTPATTCVSRKAAVTRVSGQPACWKAW